MKYEFSNKKELKQLLADLENQITKGRLLLDEPWTDDEILPAEQELPEAVKKFFKDNSVRPYKLLYELPVPFFIKDSNCEWFYINRAFCKFFEVNLKDIYQKTSHAIFPKNKADIFYKQDRQILENGKETSLEVQIVNPQGHSRVVLTTKSVFHDIHHTPYIIGTFNEITGFKNIENSINQEKVELEAQINTRTGLLTTTIEKLQDEIGQRVKTEHALIQEEDKFRSVIEQATEGIVLVDNLGRIIEWNDALTEITGIAKGKAIGKYIWDLESLLMIPEKKTRDFLLAMKNNMLAILKNEQIPQKLRNTDGIIVRADGSEKIVNFTTFPIKTQNSFYIGRIVRDVTEQKKSVLAIQRSEAQYRAIFENSSVAILIINPGNDKIIASNEKAAETYGYTREQLSGMPMSQIAMDYDIDRRHMDLLLGHNIENDFETIHITSKGEELNMLVNSSTVDYGGAIAVMNFNRNITELKQLEKARETVYKISQLTHTVDNIDDFYKSIHKIINQIIRAKNFYIAIYDESSDMVSFPYYVDEKDEPPKPYRLQRGLTEYVLRHGKPVLTTPELMKQLELSAEIEIIGTYSDIWLGVPLITHDKVIGVLAVQSYTKEIQFTENERDLLVYVSEQIAHQIFKRQAEEEILRGKAKAEESDRLKTSLITNMNHDLRTPMTGILGFASLLKNRITDPESTFMVDTIIESGNKLMSIINSILQLSQLEASQKEISTISGELSKYIEMPLAQLEIKAKQKNLYLIRKFDEPVIATFNENYFIQTINNLVNNAIAYTEKGGITIKTGYMDHEGKKYAYVSIEDTGIGISEDNFSKIFQEFRQVSEGLNRKFDGSGLGLSLSKKMIELMGGKMLMESTLGKGSVFTVLLPVSSEKTIKQKKKPDEKGEFKLTPAKKNKEKVLVVDDNRINGELILAFLKQDYEVDIATTGFLSIELVNRSEYDIVLMDINLGQGMNGIQAAKEIHKIKKDLPIVAMTGYSTEKEITEILKNNFTGYILKPIDRKALEKVLEKTIRKKT